MEIIKKSLKLYAICIAASIMCFVLVITFNMIGSNVFGEQIGYSMQGEIEGEEGATILYEYRYEEGEDLKKQEYIDKGYTLTKIPIKITKPVWDIIAQICLVIMMGVFVYNNLWKIGFKDNNAVRIGTVCEDKLKGLKIGFLATLPSIILLVVLFVGKNTFAKSVSVATYSLFVPHLHRAFYLLSGASGAYFADLELWQMVIMFALLLIMPIVATVAYILGYKSILVSEKIVYKNN